MSKNKNLKNVDSKKLIKVIEWDDKESQIKETKVRVEEGSFKNG